MSIQFFTVNSTTNIKVIPPGRNFYFISLFALILFHGFAVSVSAQNSSVNDEKSLKANIQKTTSSSKSINKNCKCDCPGAQTSEHKNLYIEKILVEGSGSKSSSLIKRTISIKEGTWIRPDDPSIEQSRLKLFALGFFDSVDFYFRKGSSRGKVILVINTRKRGTLLLKHIFMGSSRIIPFWLGLSVEEKNFLNMGITLGGSVLATTKADIMNGRSQYGAEAYAFFPSFLGIPLFLGTRFNYGSEFYRIYGSPDNGDPENFLSMPYIRGGYKLETFFPLNSFWFRVSFKNDHYITNLPSETIRHFEDGTSKKINFGIEDGNSVIGSINLKLIHDTTDRPFLPTRGHFFSMGVKFGAPVYFGAYSFTRGELNYKQYFSYEKHIFSLHFMAGAIAGNVPLFEKYYIGDIQDLVAPRALEMNMSVAPTPNFLGTNITETRWGTTAFKFCVRYDYPFMGNWGIIYRGNVFIGAGILGLATVSQLKYRESDLWSSIPIDLTFDFGIHLDTRYGMFKLSISNAIGRLPF